jgi:VIT1/CCC1 family predicted Fe2+/Mn2+ transporter
MQAVIVRLLMRGVPQTNVMTGNLTQIAIETADLVSAWLRCVREPDDHGHRRELAAVRARLFTVLAVALGFLAGAACGAVSYAKAGLAGAPIAVVIVAGLALWMVRREG